ncbi:MAG: NAD(P)-dependent oxidoreductase [Pseudomonadota bacterium]|nr:NAD(P)-dependent oxidoreductase [Pseudomonadota bacterium]
MSEKVAVIGASGFVGQNICFELSNKGFEVVGVNRKSADISEKSSLRQLVEMLRGVDLIVFAAAKAPARNVSDLVLNDFMFANFLKVVEQIKPKFILNISSDAVFGDQTDALKEDSIRAPESIHGIMHLSREILLSQLDIDCAILRPTLIYGPNDPHNGYGPNKFIRQALSGQKIELFGRGEEVRDHVYIGDVARLAERILTERFVGSLNAVSGQPISFKDVAEIVLDKVGSASLSSIDFINRVGPMPHNGYRVFDTSKLKHIFPDFVPNQFETVLSHDLALWN